MIKENGLNAKTKMLFAYGHDHHLDGMESSGKSIARLRL